MTGLGIAVAFLLLLWCALLYVPFRWRPVGMFLFMEKVAAAGYVPFIAAIGVALAVVGAVFGSLWIAVPAGLAALGAFAVVVRGGFGAGRSLWCAGSGLGRPHPGGAPDEDGSPLVDRPASQ